MTWGAADVAVVLAEAATTLSALPKTGCRPRGLPPSSVNFSICGESVPELRPEPAAITAMDAVLAWPSVIASVRDRRIVRQRADGLTWRHIGILNGLSHVGAVKVHLSATTKIAKALNSGHLPVPAGIRIPPVQPLHAAIAA